MSVEIPEEICDLYRQFGSNEERQADLVRVTSVECELFPKIRILRAELSRASDDAAQKRIESEIETAFQRLFDVYSSLWNRDKAIVELGSKSMLPAEIIEQIELLRIQRNEAEARLQELRDSTEHWSRLKSELSSTIEKAKAVFEYCQSRLNEMKAADLVCNLNAKIRELSNYWLEDERFKKWKQLEVLP